MKNIEVSKGVDRYALETAEPSTVASFSLFSSGFPRKSNLVSAHGS
jgi:hypothetical protein